MAATGERPDAYATSIFKVLIGGDDVGSFKECSGPAVEMDVYEYEEGGNNAFVHKLPGRIKVGNITLKRGVCRSGYLWDWCQAALRAVAHETWDFEPKNVTVELLDSQGNSVRQWKFEHAYPVKWSAPTFKADEDAVAVEELELAHEGLSLG